MTADAVEFQQDIFVTTDAILFSLNADGRLTVLLPRRDRAPFKGVRGLPGVAVNQDFDADAEAAARRALSLTDVEPSYLEQLQTFSGAHRDPRGWSLSVAYYALVPAATVQGVDADDMVPVDELPPLAFDHDDIVATALGRLRGKSSYSTLPMHLMPGEFTIAELQEVYEAVLGASVRPTTFRRWTEEMQDVGILVPTGGQRSTGKRPAAIYRYARTPSPKRGITLLPSISERRR